VVLILVFKCSHLNKRRLNRWQERIIELDVRSRGKTPSQRSACRSSEYVCYYFSYSENNDVLSKMEIFLSHKSLFFFSYFFLFPLLRTSNLPLKQIYNTLYRVITVMRMSKINKVFLSKHLSFKNYSQFPCL
jgi:hypothetical protein